MVHVSTVDTLAHAVDRRPVTEGQRQPANPACSYVVSKLEAEDGIQALVSRGLDAVIVHPGFMVGPFDWKPSSGQMMLSIARGLGWLAPGGGCSIVDVRAVASGVWAAAQSGRSGDHYILAGHNLTYWEIWQEMARITGVRGPRAQLPVWLAELVGGMGDLSAKFRKHEPLVNSASTAMGQLFHWYSSAKAQSTLGYEIPPWQPALQDAWDWFGQVGMRPGSRAK
jgi:dihydroflavonol-4-reductase